VISNKKTEMEDTLVKEPIVTEEKSPEKEAGWYRYWRKYCVLELVRCFRQPLRLRWQSIWNVTAS